MNDLTLHDCKQSFDPGLVREGEVFVVVREICHGGLHPGSIDVDTVRVLTECGRGGRLGKGSYGRLLGELGLPEGLPHWDVLHDEARCSGLHPVVRLLPVGPVGEEAPAEAFSHAITIGPDLPAALGLLSYVYAQLLQHETSRLWWGWNRMLATSGSPSFLYEVHACYQKLINGLRFAHGEISASIREVESEAALKMLQRKKLKFDTPGPSHYLQDWVFYRMRQQFICLLAAIHETVRDQVLPPAVASRVFSYEELLLGQLNTALPSRKPFSCRRLTGSQADDCGLQGCPHSYIDMKEAVHRFNQALGLHIRQPALRELLSERRFPHLAINRENKSIKQCYLEILIYEQTGFAHRGPKTVDRGREIAC